MSASHTTHGLREHQMQALKTIHVVILHDCDDVARLLEEMLHSLGFMRTTRLRTAVEVSRLMQDSPVHLLIFDSAMSFVIADSPAFSLAPDITGTDFIRRLRHAQGSPNRFVPAIMLVDGMDVQGALQARDAGVNEILTKPFNAMAFCQRMIHLFDSPRHFIMAEAYKGPCRRVQKTAAIPPHADRRMREIRVIRCNETMGAR